MSTRLAKQLIYGTFYVIVWVLVIWVGFALFTHPAASCFDKIQNQGELGVDCGGPCAMVCTAGAPPITLVPGTSVMAFTSTPRHETFLAQVENPNAGSAAESFSYAFNVYDASGTLLQSFPAQSYLFAQQVKYLLLMNQAVPDSVASDDITIGNTDWVTTSTLGAVPQLAVQNVTTKIGSSALGSVGTVVATGQLANIDTATFHNIFIVAVFKDANGNPIAASQTLLDSIAPGQIEDFSVSYPAVSGIDPTKTDVEAYAFRQ